MLDGRQKRSSGLMTKKFLMGVIVDGWRRNSFARTILFEMAEDRLPQAIKPGRLAWRDRISIRHCSGWEIIEGGEV